MFGSRMFVGIYTFELICDVWFSWPRFRGFLAGLFRSTSFVVWGLFPSDHQIATHRVYRSVHSILEQLSTLFESPVIYNFPASKTLTSTHIDPKHPHHRSLFFKICIHISIKKKDIHLSSTNQPHPPIKNSPMCPSLKI